jgi:hypothetical protein
MVTARRVNALLVARRVVAQGPQARMQWPHGSVVARSACIRPWCGARARNAARPTVRSIRSRSAARQSMLAMMVACIRPCMIWVAGNNPRRGDVGRCLPSESRSAGKLPDGVSSVTDCSIKRNAGRNLAGWWPKWSGIPASVIRARPRRKMALTDAESEECWVNAS